jgi:hypothetical protein
MNAPPASQSLEQELTELMRTPTGTRMFRPLQARALVSAHEAGGLFCNAAVGMGKTDVCAVAMQLLGGARPMVLTEASNIPQMRADFQKLRQHWQMPSHYWLEAYEKLGSPLHANLLEERNPTCLILDEAHKNKHVKVSARARRVDRWRRANPQVPVLCLSGSPGSELEDYAHLLLWAIPSLAGDLIPVDAEGRPGGADFKLLCKRLKDPEEEAFRSDFRERLCAMPGVVISPDTFTEKPIRIVHTVLDTPAEMEPHWEQLRDVGEAPDGWFLEGPAEQWGLARCLSNGMYYEHVPRPPEPWREARTNWYRFCRELIEDEKAPGGPWDTEGQVARGVLAGSLPRDLYDAWVAIKDTYQPEIKTTWLSSHTVDYAVQWGKEHLEQTADTRQGGGAIVWVEQTGVGEELARRTRWPYYASGATNAKGEHVRNAKAPIIICAVKSCGTGKNLQRYSRNLFLSPPSNNDQAEQWFGRTHRSGQPQGEVFVELVYGCLEDWNAIVKAEAEARDVEIDLTTPQKLSLATHERVDYPAEDGAAWRKKPLAVTVNFDD